METTCIFSSHLLEEGVGKGDARISRHLNPLVQGVVSKIARIKGERLYRQSQETKVSGT
jgi:hypothetical protein